MTKLNIELENIPLNFLKVVYHDEELNSRNILLIGIKTDNMHKWNSSLQSITAPNMVSIDHALVGIKKKVYLNKNIEYLSDSDVESTEGDINHTYNNMASMHRGQSVDTNKNLHLNMK